jgi:hypothetical protein
MEYPWDAMEYQSVNEQNYGKSVQTDNWVGKTWNLMFP